MQDDVYRILKKGRGEVKEAFEVEIHKVTIANQEYIEGTLYFNGQAISTTGKTREEVLSDLEKQLKEI